MPSEATEGLQLVALLIAIPKVFAAVPDAANVKVVLPLTTVTLLEKLLFETTPEALESNTKKVFVAVTPAPAAPSAPADPSAPVFPSAGTHFSLCF